MIRSEIAGRVVAAVAAACAGTTLVAAIDADDAASPPAATAPADPTAIPPAVLPGPSGAERAAWIVAYTGGAAYFVTVIGAKLIDLMATGKKRWHEAEAGTDHQRWTACEEQRAQQAEAIQRKDSELISAWALCGQKDQHIKQLTEQVAHLLEVTATLTQTIGTNNRSLIERLPAPSSAPVAVTIDPASTPIAVHDAGPAPEAKS